MSSQQTPIVSGQPTVAPNKAKLDGPIPTAASKWKKATLDFLNAEYIREEETQFESLQALVLPEGLQEG